MNICSGSIRGSILAAVLIAGVMVGGAIAFAQAGGEDVRVRGETGGITFPVAELGDCASKEECHAYCDQSAHMDACIAFARAHGLMNKEEAERSEKFSERLKDGKTPGGCDSPASCNAYCEDIAHLDECVTFAEKHDFTGKEYAHGKQLRSYLKQGGTMPGGCTSRASCEAYCGDFAHAEECYRFAERAGVADEMGDAAGDHKPSQKISPEHLKRLGELAEKGETPGGCMNKDACMAYCELPGHMEECVSFGEKVGFMKKEEAERARKFMSKGGPGGCTSREACDAFCNIPENQETCFTFAKENDLIPPEELERMKEGWVRMRQGLENAPSEVKECLTSTMGAGVIEDIQSGKLVPGPAIGERVRDCFEKFGASHDPEKMFTDAPLEVKTCLKEKLGEQYAGISSGKTEPTPEIADTFRVCFQQREFERGGWENGGHEDQGGAPGIGGDRGPNPEMLRTFLRSAPPEIQLCLKEKLGERFAEIQQGTLMPGPEMGEVMRSCFESFRPREEGRNEGMRGEMMPPPVPAEGGRGEGGWPIPPSGAISPGTLLPREQMMNFMNQFPPGLEPCLKERLGEEGFIKIATEGRTPELEMAIRACLSSVPAGSGEMRTQVAPSVEGSGTMFQGGGWTGNLPLPIQECLKAKFGEQFAVLGYQSPTPETETAIRECYTGTGGGGSPTAPIEFMPTDGTIAPPPETMRLESRKRTFPQQLLGAVAAPFLTLWHVFR